MVTKKALKAREPTAFDIELGRRVRERRKELKLSQETFGRMIGVSFQQVGKYEIGQNRFSVSRLVRVCESLRLNMYQLLKDIPL